MDELEMMESSEFNNAGELLGFDMDLGGELSARLSRMDPVRRMRAINKLAPKRHHSRGSRAEMEKFFKELPKHIKQELIAGKLRLADTTIYSVKKVNSKTVKMFETQDDKEIAISNVSNAKLTKNFAFIVSAVQLKAGHIIQPPGGDPIDEDEALKSLRFTSMIDYPAIANGEHSFKANKKQIIPEGEINEKFVTDNYHNMPLGTYKLDNPRLVHDEELLEFTVELGTMYGIPDDTYLRLVLFGTGTIP